MHTFSQSFCTSTSANCLQVIRLSIHPSKVAMGAASDAGDNLAGSGALPTSSMLVSMLCFFCLDYRVGFVDGGELELDDDKGQLRLGEMSVSDREQR